MRGEIFERVDRIEPFDANARKAIKAVNPIEFIILGLAGLDESRGVGVIGTKLKCVWLKDGRRVTFRSLDYGGHIGDVSRLDDPSVLPIGYGE